MNRPGLILTLVAIATLSAPAAAPAQAWTLGAGAGGIDYEASLGPAYHVNVRRALGSWSDLRLGPAESDSWRIPALHLEGDLLVQVGRSGTKVRECTEQAAFCAAGADPLALLGAGLAARIDLLKAERKIQLYFIPLSATLFAQTGEVYESLLGSFESTRTRETKIAAGVGNGAGIELRLGEIAALLEIRAILVRDLEGARSGSLPISVGVRW